MLSVPSLCHAEVASRECRPGRDIRLPRYDSWAVTLAFPAWHLQPDIPVGAKEVAMRKRYTRKYTHWSPRWKWRLKDQAILREFERDWKSGRGYILRRAGRRET